MASLGKGKLFARFWVKERGFGVYVERGSIAIDANLSSRRDLAERLKRLASALTTPKSGTTSGLFHECEG